MTAPPVGADETTCRSNPPPAVASAPTCSSDAPTRPRGDARSQGGWLGGPGGPGGMATKVRRRVLALVRDLGRFWLPTVRTVRRWCLGWPLSVGGSRPGGLKRGHCGRRRRIGEGGFIRVRRHGKTPARRGERAAAERRRRRRVTPGSPRRRHRHRKFLVPIQLLPLLLVLVMPRLSLSLNQAIAVETVPTSRFPAIVSIRGRAQQHVCTGAAIARWHVLTAAHCIDRAGHNLLIAFGQVVANSSWHPTGVKGITEETEVHPRKGCPMLKQKQPKPVGATCRKAARAPPVERKLYRGLRRCSA
ncbi:unnamed protein product [Ostreobium quekettii]|uniref:Peptidase S1 domain-containing protein n=1 Tax=Ostreobium quekettii TaxID=121088 RepID=A0A8S1IV92_9CHLO|nr:unnamed protein product [Ostreobium quekettii]